MADLVHRECAAAPAGNRRLWVPRAGDLPWCGSRHSHLAFVALSPRSLHRARTCRPRPAEAAQLHPGSKSLPRSRFAMSWIAHVGPDHQRGTRCMGCLLVGGVRGMAKRGVRGFGALRARRATSRKGSWLRGPRAARFDAPVRRCRSPPAITGALDMGARLQSMDHERIGCLATPRWTARHVIGTSWGGSTTLPCNPLRFRCLAHLTADNVDPLAFTS